MINEKQIKEAQKILNECSQPVILFDDDPDGLCSFALLYAYLQKGYGIVVKNSPNVTKDIYYNKIMNYDPDLVIILDKPAVDDDFIDGFDCPILWIDHHGVQNPFQKNVYYFNPLQNSSESSPTTLQCWEIIKDKDFAKNNRWLAVVGCIGDWFLPKKVILDLIQSDNSFAVEGAESAPDYLFMKDSKIGKLVKILNFSLKGKTKDVEANFKVLTRIESADEILLQLTPKGKFFYKNFSKINTEYERLLEEAMSMRSESFFLTAILHQNKFSFSSELSNEVLYYNKDKIIILGRSSDGYTKGSVRTTFPINIHNIIQLAVMGVEGYGGGHPQACGFRIADSDFELFLKRLKEGCLDELEKVK